MQGIGERSLVATEWLLYGEGGLPLWAVLPLAVVTLILRRILLVRYSSDSTIFRQMAVVDRCERGRHLCSFISATSPCKGIGRPPGHLPNEWAPFRFCALL